MSWQASSSTVGRTRTWKRQRRTQWHAFTTQRRARAHRVRTRARQRGLTRPPKWAREPAQRWTQTRWQAHRARGGTWATWPGAGG